MATSTHTINLTPNKYENVSNGNANCTLVVATGERIRIHVGGSAPPPGGPDYATVTGPGTSQARGAVLTVSNLEAETDLWARAETEPTKVTVIRGPSTVWIGSA